MTKAILMYHRVCALTEETECYFARGTAVTPESFRRQLKWLSRRFAFTTVRDLAFGERTDRPTVALTFDDGYRDVVEQALPACREFGAVATVYVCASTLLDSKALWFDDYYALVPRLRAAPQVWDLIAAECGEPPVSDLRWWVRGPLKARLAALDRDGRDALLGRLEALLNIGSGSSASARYLHRNDLASLMAAGWEVGGHGGQHERLTELPDHPLAAEIAESAKMLLELGAAKPWTIAYPDGAVDERVVAAAATRFSAGVTVVPELFDASLSRLQLPRLLCRGDSEVPHPGLVP